MNDDMKLDVIIPVFKPDDKLRALLEGLAKQTLKPSRIIIMYTMTDAGDHLSDDYIRFASEVSDVSVYELARCDFDHGGTRALAMTHSKADIAVMMTMDAIPDNNMLLEKLTERLTDKTVGAAYARQVPGKDSSPAERFTRGFNYPGEECLKGREDIQRLGIKAFFCSNVCAAYRRDVYDELGGFIKRTIFNEDMIYAHKLIMNGYRIHYAADARVIHTHEYTAMQQLHRNFDLAVSQAEHPEVFGGISSESEGVKYIKSAYGFFAGEHRPWLIIPFVWGCCFRYLGYILGKNHTRLPHGMVKALAMNREYFG